MTTLSTTPAYNGKPIIFPHDGDADIWATLADTDALAVLDDILAGEWEPNTGDLRTLVSETAENLSSMGAEAGFYFWHDRAANMLIFLKVTATGDVEPIWNFTTKEG